MSPISKYFGGHGSEVMAQMKKKNGEKGGESEFYATANSRPGMKPAEALAKPKRKMTLGQRIAAKD